MELATSIANLIINEEGGELEDSIAKLLHRKSSINDEEEEEVRNSIASFFKLFYAFY